MNTNTLTFVTSNKGKFAWLERALQLADITHIRAEMHALDLLEIQSENLAEISLYKARQAYALLQKPVIVQDSGFYIKQLNGFPGPFARYMFDQMGVDAIAKLAGTLTDKSCAFDNVLTYMNGPDSYQQFHDSTGDLFTLSHNVWPHDHPKQWASIWRILIPSGLGYTNPMASFKDAELDRYSIESRDYNPNSSAIDLFALSLKEQHALKCSA